MTSMAHKTGCVALYASRIRFLGANALQAHEFGAQPGTDDAPWDVPFQRMAAPIYRDALPDSYLARLCSVFLGCSLTMEEQRVPRDLASQWNIVRCYFDTATEAISREIGLDEVEPMWEDPTDQEPTTPGVVRFDELATLASSKGFATMIDAAEQVADYLSGLHVLRTESLALLRDLAAGKRILDIAIEHGSSERTLHREMADLWSELGVANRQQGIALAAQNGWLT